MIKTIKNIKKLLAIGLIAAATLFVTSPQAKACITNITFALNNAAENNCTTNALVYVYDPAYDCQVSVNPSGSGVYTIHPGYVANNGDPCTNLCAYGIPARWSLIEVYLSNSCCQTGVTNTVGTITAYDASGTNPSFPLILEPYKPSAQWRITHKPGPGAPLFCTNDVVNIYRCWVGSSCESQP